MYAHMLTYLLYNYLGLCIYSSKLKDSLHSSLRCIFAQRKSSTVNWVCLAFS